MTDTDDISSRATCTTKSQKHQSAGYPELYSGAGLIRGTNSVSQLQMTQMTAPLFTAQRSEYYLDALARHSPPCAPGGSGGSRPGLRSCLQASSGVFSNALPPSCCGSRNPNRGSAIRCWIQLTSGPANYSRLALDAVSSSSFCANSTFEITYSDKD